MKVLEQNQSRALRRIITISEHMVEPDAGYCLVCRRGVQRAGLVEWAHEAS